MDPQIQRTYAYPSHAHRQFVQPVLPFQASPRIANQVHYPPSPSYHQASLSSQSLAQHPSSIQYQPAVIQETLAHHPAHLFYELPPGPIPSVLELPPIENVSRGLEPLVGLSLFFLRGESLEWPQGAWELNNRFSVLNEFGHRIFFIGEQYSSNCCTPESYRPFLLHVFSPRGQLILQAQRPDSTGLCFWGADISGNNLDVTIHSNGAAMPLGRVQHSFGSICCSNVGHWDVLSPWGTPLLQIEGSWKSTGPWGTCYYGDPKMYPKISLFTSAGQTAFLWEHKLKNGEKLWGMQVPPYMESELKAILLCFLVDIYITFVEGVEAVRNGVVEYDEHGYAETYHVTNPRRRGCTPWSCIGFTMLCALILGPLCIVFYVVLPYSHGRKIL